MKLYSIIITVISIVLVTGCKEKEIIIPDVGVQATDKVVLVEEFTGVGCPNCPDAAILLENEVAKYTGNIIPVAVHSNALASPRPNSKYDFRSEVAENLEKYIGQLFSKPAAAIDRIPVQMDGNPYAVEVNDWPWLIASEIQKEPEVNISIEKTYNPTNRNLNFTVKYDPTVNLNVPLRLNAWILESHIIDPQDDSGGRIDDYEHNHVLRDMITAVEGEAIGVSFNEGVVYEKSYSYTIPPQDGWWVAENCTLVVFVNELTENPDSKRVLQAHEVHVTD
jgi:thiol-disulfide isomerase/thioredoxin